VEWGIVYYKTPEGVVPAEDFLDGLATSVEAKFDAVLEAVRSAPPPQFSGGGYWEAMHGTMNGYYEVRIRAQQKLHRLFCLLDNADEDGLAERGFDGPQIAVLNGMTKAVGKRFSDAEYRRNVRDLGDRYMGTFPRPVAD